jgi:SNF2 family DNA or RNA helicase
LLADEVGLGKTYATIAGIEAVGEGLSVLVVCPLSVAAHWRRSIEAMGAGGNRWCVVNYDRLKNLLEVPDAAKSAKRVRTKNKRHVEQGESLVQWDIIVADESHLLENPTSQRTKALQRLVRSKPGNSFVVWASATAGQNPVELSYLSPLLADLTGSKASAFKDFDQWCSSQGIQVRKGAYGAVGWERNEEDLERMRKLLFTGVLPGGIRRRPTDIAGWPELERIAWPVELESEERRMYQEAWEEVREALVADTARRREGGRTLPGTGDLNPLVALLRFRQKASLLRARATVEHTLDLLANDRQVLISVEFLETAELLAEMLNKRRVHSVAITGAQNAGERERARIEFQQGKAPVVIFTIREGISLHAGEKASNATTTERVTILHDPRWSAIATAQIEGRAHRDGQRAVAYHAFGEETVEEKVVRRVLERLSDMKTMIGDDTDALELLREIVEN